MNLNVEHVSLVQEKSTRRKSKKVLSDDDEEYINDENEFEHSPTKESIIGKNGEDESGNDLGVVSGNLTYFLFFNSTSTEIIRGFCFNLKEKKNVF